VNDFRTQLEAQEVICRQLHTSHAFHSAMMDPIVEPLRAAISSIKLHAPERSFVSTVTGLPITVEQATDPKYWAGHARARVEFTKATRYLKENDYDLFVECGPRSTMCALVRQQFSTERPCIAIPTFGDTSENNAEWDTLLFAMGSLWQNGVNFSWSAFYSHEERRKIPLPTYPFQRARYWIDPLPVQARASAPAEITANFARRDSETANGSSGTSVGVETTESVALSRRDRIASLLTSLLAALSGREKSQINTTATFMEQGFDSLSLTQVAFTIRKEFRTKVSFSSLMNEFPNVDMLADHLDQSLPADMLTETRPSTPSAPKPEVKVDTFSIQPQKTGSPLDEAIVMQAQVIARLVNLLEEAGVHLPVALAAAAEAGAPEAADNSRRRVTRSVSNPQSTLEVQSTIPQLGIFASSCLSKDLSASYNESMTVYFTGTISQEKMTRAIDRLVERHDALRAGFDDSGRTMKIRPQLKIAVSVSDLSAKDSSKGALEQQEKNLRAAIAEDVAQSFNLPDGPLFRCQLILLAPDRAAVVLTAHHVICDGWSLDVMIHDLCAYYSEELTSVRGSLEAAESYLEYVQQVTKRQLSEEFKQAETYWRRKFADGFPILVLPTDHPRKPRRDFRARCLDYSVQDEVAAALRSMTAAQGCSFFTGLVGALAILLARISHQRRFVICLPTAEQPVSGQPGLVGHCVNLLPLAVEFREGDTVSGFFKRLQQDLIAAQEHSVYTLVSLLQDLRPPADHPGISTVSAGFTNTGRFRSGQLPQSGFTVDYDLNPKAFESFEFYLNAVESEGKVDLHCHFDIGLFEEVTIREWLADLSNIFRDVAADPARDVPSLAHLNRSNSLLTGMPVFAQLTSGSESREALSATDKSRDEIATQSTNAGSSMSEQELLQSLIALWRRVLSVGRIGPDDDFFAAGGNSMLAAALFASVKKELGYAPSLAVLYDASTPRSLAKHLSRGKRSEDWQSLVAINRHGDRTPLFLVHAAEGNVLLYRSLAAHLGADQPVWGLQSAGLDGKTRIDPKFENVAALYIEQIRTIQPHGPYMLGGYCLGGTIALEMAHQLIEAGEEVGLVAMIEDYNLRAMRWPLATHHHLLNRFLLNPWFHLKNALAAEGHGKFDFFVDKLNVELRRMKVSLRGSLNKVEDLFFPRGSAALPVAKLADVYDEAQEHYDIKPYPGELTLFFAEKHLAGFNIPLGGWEGVATGGARLYSIPCYSRGSLIEPYVKHLARGMRACLDRAAEKSAAAANKQQAMDVVSRKKEVSHPAGVSS
jgi:thioesterase domain-containing protein/acyl carrier protein